MANVQIPGLVALVDVSEIANVRVPGLVVLVDVSEIANVRVPGLVVLVDAKESSASPLVLQHHHHGYFSGHGL